MNILLVEDEIGLREGLAALLQHRGHVVRTAATCAAGVESARIDTFDVVVTDWRLGDGLGRSVVEACPCPAVVMSGYPEEVDAPSGRTTILAKPVAPQRLFDVIARIDVEGRDDRPPRDASEDPLAVDVRARIDLALALVGASGADAVQIDDEFACLRVRLGDDDPMVLEQLERLGGDLRVLERTGQRWLELRLYRDGRPDGAVVVGPEDDWPARPQQVAIDIRRFRDCTPKSFLALARRAMRERGCGRSVDLLNVPTHLRLHLEIHDLGHLLLNRPKSGPRLPEVLQVLWS